jgi:hypothetical protein
MHQEDIQLPDRINQLRSRYPDKSHEELVAMIRFLDRYLEIALSIYLEATPTSSRKTTL